MDSRSPKVGLWMVGACGGVGSTVALGIAALRKGLATVTGLVSALPAFRKLDLVDPKSIIVGGHEVRSETFLEAVRGLRHRSNVFDESLIKACSFDLRAAQRNVRPGTLLGAGANIRRMADRSGLMGDRTPWNAVERLSGDMDAFRWRNRLDQVVVICVASSEPPLRRGGRFAGFPALQQALARRGPCVLSTSSLYALASIEAHCPFINFTPSPGVSVSAIAERAVELGVPYMGNDGKTGETLVKSALAPMFAMRNLGVLSWVGENILGNRDGDVLRDPRTRIAKIKSKDKTLSPIIGNSLTTKVGIDYVPSLDDWKVAWDFIHFEGFLGTRMSMQFTWQGCDSLLAAPLVIDLARFAAREADTRHGGSMRHLACFFKDPIDVKERDLHSQFQRLLDYASASRR